jgi:hypothetical protein
VSDTRKLNQLLDALEAVNQWYPASANPPQTTASSIRVPWASKPPLPIGVLSIRREAVDVLTSWALVIAEGRDLRPGIAAGDVAALVAFLKVHAEWVLECTGDDILNELQYLAHQLEQIVKQSRPSVRRLVPCPEPMCGGDLVAVMRDSDPLLPSAIKCSAFPLEHVWTSHEWHGLGRRLMRDLDEEGIARLVEMLGSTRVG